MVLGMHWMCMLHDSPQLVSNSGSGKDDHIMTLKNSLQWLLQAL